MDIIKMMASSFVFLPEKLAYFFINAIYLRSYFSWILVIKVQGTQEYSMHQWTDFQALISNRKSHAKIKKPANSVYSDLHKSLIYSSYSVRHVAFHILISFHTMMFLYERHCFFSITSYALMPFFLVLESVDNALCHIYVEQLEELYQALEIVIK